MKIIKSNLFRHAVRNVFADSNENMSRLSGPKKANDAKLGQCPANVTRLITVGGLRAAALISALVLCATTAYADETSAADEKSKQGSLSEIGAKLANPVSDIWALFTEFDFYFSDGNLNKGASEFGSRMLFQPIMPLPIYGSGDNAWKLITRPTVPVFFNQPVPQRGSTNSTTQVALVTFSYLCWCPLPREIGCWVRVQACCCPPRRITLLGDSNGASGQAPSLAIRLRTGSPCSSPNTTLG